MKIITTLIFLCINFIGFAQPPVKELNKFKIKHLPNNNTLTAEQSREITYFKKKLNFFRDASKKKVFWPNGRPKNGTGYGKYYQGKYSYEGDWKKYKMNGKLTIKVMDNLVVFEGTAKDGIIQQGTLYSYIEHPTYGLFQIPIFYGEFIPYAWEKDDYYIYYQINGTKFILDEDNTKKPFLKKAEYGYQQIDMFDKSFYSGFSFYYINNAPRNKPADWHLLYQLHKDNGNHYSGVCINYEQLHNYETANTKFYNKKPKYYVKYAYRNFDRIDKNKYQVFDATTNKPVNFNPNHIISEFDDNHERQFVVYYDDEDWQKRISFIERQKAEKARIKRLEEEAIQHTITKLKHEDDIYNASQETVTYHKNGNTYVEKKFNVDIPWSEYYQARIRFYDSESDMNYQKNGRRADMVSFKASKDDKGQWLTGTPLDGFFKGKFYYTNDSITSIKSKFYTSKLVNKATINKDNLLYIGIVCSHNLFPTKSWSTILKSDKQYIYGLINTHKLASDGSLTFHYKSKNNKRIRVTIYPNELGETNTIFRIKIEVNKKSLFESLSETFKAINESQNKMYESLKEYNEKMKKVNENLKALNKN